MHFILLLLFGVMIVGWIVLLRSMRGRIMLSAPSCAECRYDLRGVDVDERLTCPECGADLNTKHAVHFGHFQRSGKKIFLGVLMIMPFIFAMGGSLLQQATGVEWLDVKPSSWVLSDLEGTGVDRHAWKELTRRLEADSLSDEQIRRAIEQCIRFKQQSIGTSAYSSCKYFLTAADFAGLITDEQMNRLARAYFGETPSLNMRDKVRHGTNWHIDIRTDGWHNWLSYDALFYIRSMTIDGEPFEPLPAHSLRGSESKVYSGTSNGDLRLVIPIVVQPGMHRIEFDFDMGIHDSGLHPIISGNPSAPGPPEDWPVMRTTWSGAISREFEVLPIDEPAVGMIRDPALVEELRAVYQPRRIIVREDRRHWRVEVDAPRTEPGPVVVYFEIVIRFPDGEELSYARFNVRSGGSYGWSGGTRRIAEFDPALTHADIILRPDVERAERNLEIDAIWGEEIVYEDVPIEVHRAEETSESSS